MENEILTAVGSLGVGAVLGVTIFLMYRQDRRCSEDRLSKLIEADQKSRERATNIQSELLTYLKAKNGHKD